MVVSLQLVREWTQTNMVVSLESYNKPELYAHKEIRHILEFLGVYTEPIILDAYRIERSHILGSLWGHTETSTLDIYRIRHKSNILLYLGAH
jgi:hypothetical protein